MLAALTACGFSGDPPRVPIQSETPAGLSE
jgi:hypothetical protein